VSGVSGGTDYQTQGKNVLAGYRKRVNRRRGPKKEVSAEEGKERGT